ncbi:MAG: prohibitin family protein [bacterium]
MEFFVFAVIIILGTAVASMSVPHMRNLILAVGGVLLVLLLAATGLVVVPAGHVGVVDVFGRVQATSLNAGMQAKLPWARVIMMNIQLAELKEHAEVPAKNGLNLGMDISVWYRLNGATAPRVYRELSVTYANTVVAPLMRSELRAVTAMHEPMFLYTSDRTLIANTIMESAAPVLMEKGVILEKVLLREVTPPDEVRKAIEQVTAAENEARRMEFVIAKETQEAERKRIEAKGISDFQRIVMKDITEGLLRWKGIEATAELAKSSNAKVVIIGSGKDGLPIILNP